MNVIIISDLSVITAVVLAIEAVIMSVIAIVMIYFARKYFKQKSSVNGAGETHIGVNDRAQTQSVGGEAQGYTANTRYTAHFESGNKENSVQMAAPYTAGGTLVSGYTAEGYISNKSEPIDQAISTDKLSDRIRRAIKTVINTIVKSVKTVVRFAIRLIKAMFRVKI